MTGVNMSIHYIDVTSSRMSLGLRLRGILVLLVVLAHEEHEEIKDASYVLYLNDGVVSSRVP